MSRAITEPIEIEVQNIGGIDHTSVKVVEGTTLLVGRNGTHRTSLLRSIMAALGSTRVSLRAGADEGRVELSLNGETYSRVLEKKDGDIVFGGEPYLDPQTAQSADLFAFLTVDNKIRQLIRTESPEGKLRELLMRPIDTDEIDYRLASLRDKIADRNEEREELEKQASELPELTQRWDDLSVEQSQIKEQIEQLEAEIKASELDIDEVGSQQEEFASVLAELNQKQKKLTTARQEQAQEQQRLDRLREQRGEIQTNLDSLDIPDTDSESLKKERDKILDQLEVVEATLQQLDDLIELNEVNLDRAQLPIEGINDDSSSKDSSATEDLSTDTTVCWTCGQTVLRTTIEQTIQQLRDARAEAAARRNTLEQERTEIEAQLRQWRDKRDEKSQLESELDKLDAQISKAERTLTEIDSRIETYNEEISELKNRLQKINLTDRHEELLELHEELAQARQDRKQVDHKLSKIEEQITAAEDAKEKIPEVETEIEKLKEQRDKLKNRVAEREREIVTTINKHMETVLSELQYDGVERIWVERHTSPDSESTFDIHVVRDHGDGGINDRIEHLSESEREIVGLVVALAGYLAHDVYEDLPFFLLDSLEAIDATRIAGLLEHVSEYSDYTVAAVLQGDATTGNLAHQADAIHELDPE